ncbi:MAG: ATP-binding cassette domain-containing protein [Bacteroidetes bacterium]|nr:MAG: ATP-binding cassette domain-containing protein [Bacteroidota bacterium]
MTTAPVITIENVSVFQENTPVLRDVSFSVQKGEFVYLIGKTGSGKSSLLKTLYADLPLMVGEAEVAGFSLRKLPRSKVPYLRRNLGIIFQDFQLLSDRTVSDNLIFVMKATGWKSKTKIRQKLTELLVEVGLGSAGNKYPHQLSGGEQQRVAVARALVNEPAILLADEPTGNLDPEVAEDILKLFIDINHKGTSVLMATHNHEFLNKYPKRTLRCIDKEIVED